MRDIEHAANTHWMVGWDGCVTGLCRWVFFLGKTDISSVFVCVHKWLGGEPIDL